MFCKPKLDMHLNGGVNFKLLITLNKKFILELYLHPSHSFLGAL